MTVDLPLSCVSGAATFNSTGTTHYLRRIVVTINSTPPPSTVILRKQGVLAQPLLISPSDPYILSRGSLALPETNHEERVRDIQNYDILWFQGKKSAQVGITEHKEHDIYKLTFIGRSLCNPNNPMSGRDFSYPGAVGDVFVSSNVISRE